MTKKFKRITDLHTYLREKNSLGRRKMKVKKKKKKQETTQRVYLKEYYYK